MADTPGAQIVLKCVVNCGDIFEQISKAYQHSLDLSTEDVHHGQFELIQIDQLTDQEKTNLALATGPWPPDTKHADLQALRQQMRDTLTERGDAGPINVHATCCSGNLRTAAYSFAVKRGHRVSTAIEYKTDGTVDFYAKVVSY